MRNGIVTTASMAAATSAPVEETRPSGSKAKSGSMSGFPIDTAKQTMELCIQNLNPNDTFNLMTFAGGVGFCFPGAVPNTEENQRQALQYLRNLQGSGGTEMMKAINAALVQTRPEQSADGVGLIRIVCFMGDG
mgnify:CR=1 FL=1